MMQHIVFIAQLLAFLPFLDQFSVVVGIIQFASAAFFLFTFHSFRFVFCPEAVVWGMYIVPGSGSACIYQDIGYPVLPQGDIEDHH